MCAGTTVGPCHGHRSCRRDGGRTRESSYPEKMLHSPYHLSMESLRGVFAFWVSSFFVDRGTPARRVSRFSRRFKDPLQAPLILHDETQAKNSTCEAEMHLTCSAHPSEKMRGCLFRQLERGDVAVLYAPPQMQVLVGQLVAQSRL